MADVGAAAESVGRGLVGKAALVYKFGNLTGGGKKKGARSRSVSEKGDVTDVDGIQALNSFKTDLSRFAEKVDARLEDVVRLVALKILRGVILKTPVDTGIARASWVVGVGQKHERFIAQQGQTAQTPNIPERRPPSSEIIISNYVPYIHSLDKGSSTQAPNGMVALTLSEVKQEIDRIMKEL